MIKEPDGTIVISRGGTKMNDEDVLNLMWMERSDKERFLRLVSDIVSFEVA